MNKWKEKESNGDKDKKGVIVRLSRKSEKRKGKKDKRQSDFFEIPPVARLLGALGKIKEIIIEKKKF